MAGCVVPQFLVECLCQFLVLPFPAALLGVASVLALETRQAVLRSLQCCLLRLPTHIALWSILWVEGMVDPCSPGHHTLPASQPVFPCRCVKVKPHRHCRTRSSVSRPIKSQNPWVTLFAFEWTTATMVVVEMAARSLKGAGTVGSEAIHRDRQQTVGILEGEDQQQWQNRQVLLPGSRESNSNSQGLRPSLSTPAVDEGYPHLRVQRRNWMFELVWRALWPPKEPPRGGRPVLWPRRVVLPPQATVELSTNTSMSPEWRFQVLRLWLKV